MTEIKALEVSLGEDLRHFSASLWRRGLAHRITEHQGKQVVWVPDEGMVESVLAHYRDFQADPDRAVAPPSGPRRRSGFWSALRRLPVTALLLVGSLLGAAVVSLDFNLTALFTFQKLSVIDGQLHMEWPTGEYWRLVTPIFLHFSILHIAFNALWLWELGRRIEASHGSLQLLGISLLMGIGSNLAQAIHTADTLFGGMSGVIYGYLGYIIVWNRLRPAQAFDVPNAVMVFLLVWLVLCLAGFASLLGFGDVANAAHVGGLAMGLVLGLVSVVVAWRQQS